MSHEHVSDVGYWVGLDPAKLSDPAGVAVVSVRRHEIIADRGDYEKSMERAYQEGRVLRVSDQCGRAMVAGNHHNEGETIDQWHSYVCGHVERHHGEDYRLLVARIADLMNEPELRSWHAPLVIDTGGCGEPVADMFRSVTDDERIWRYTISAGDRINPNGMRRFSIPKSTIMSTLSVLLGTDRLVISETQELGRSLAQELRSLKERFTASGHQQFDTFNAGQHDDLALALGGMLVVAERVLNRKMRDRSTYDASRYPPYAETMESPASREEHRRRSLSWLARR